MYSVYVTRCLFIISHHSHRFEKKDKALIFHLLVKKKCSYHSWVGFTGLKGCGNVGQGLAPPVGGPCIPEGPGSPPYHPDLQSGWHCGTWSFAEDKKSLQWGECRKVFQASIGKQFLIECRFKINKLLVQLGSSWSTMTENICESHILGNARLSWNHGIVQQQTKIISFTSQEESCIRSSCPKHPSLWPQDWEISQSPWLWKIWQATGSQLWQLLLTSIHGQVGEVCT